MAWSIGVALGALLVGSVAGPTSPFDLHVEREGGAVDCPDAAALTASIDDIERHPATGAAATTPGVRAEVTFARAETGYRATLRLRGAKVGERTLTDTGASCAALGRAVAIALALSLEGDPDPPVPVVTTPALTPPPAPPTPRRTSVSIGIEGGVVAGAVGAPSFGAGLDVGVALGRGFVIEGGGRHVLARASALSPGEVRVSLDAAILRLCAVVAGARRPLQADVCATGAAGALRGEGVGYPTAGSAASAWIAAGGGLDARWRLGPWSLVLGLEALAPLRQDTFSIENRGVAFRSSAVSWTTRLGVAFQVR
jgi:hypothetical protein